MLRPTTGRLLAVTCLLNITTFIGCQSVTGNDSNDNTGKTQNANASAAVTSVAPPSAAPGHRVRVTADQPIFGEGSAAYVQIGGQTASIANVIDDTQADVFVPNLSPGGVSVAIVEPDKDPGTPGRLVILAPASQQLLLSLNEGRLELISAMPRAGEFHRFSDPDEPRIAFDVFNAQGGLIYTGAIANPTLGRLEIYDQHEDDDEGGHVLRRGTPTSSAVFPLMIPHLPGIGLVKFYEADAGVDLASAEGREQRRFLSEIQIANH